MHDIWYVTPVRGSVNPGSWPTGWKALSKTQLRRTTGEYILTMLVAKEQWIQKRISRKRSVNRQCRVGPCTPQGRGRDMNGQHRMGSWDLQKRNPISLWHLRVAAMGKLDRLCQLWQPVSPLELCSAEQMVPEATRKPCMWALRSVQGSKIRQYFQNSSTRKWWYTWKCIHI